MTAARAARTAFSPMFGCSRRPRWNTIAPRISTTRPAAASGARTFRGPRKGVATSAMPATPAKMRSSERISITYFIPDCRRAGFGRSMKTKKIPSRTWRIHKTTFMQSVSLGRAGPLIRVGLGLGRLDDLALDVDLDFVTDDELAVQHHVESHTEVLTVDLRLGGITNAVPHVGVIELAVFHDFECDWPGGCLERQVAGDFVAVLADVLDLGALESHRRIFIDLEEIGLSAVFVPLLL